MKLKDFDLKTLLIVALVIIIILMRSCDGSAKKPAETIKIEGKKYEVVKREVDTLRIPVKVTEYRPGKTIYVERPVYVNVPPGIDTLEILKDYYAKRVYRDTLTLKDNLGFIVVNDTISKNSIFGRTWDAQVNKITVTDQIFLKEPPKTQVYIGLVAGFDRPNIINFAGPSLILKTKQDRMYSLGIGYSGSNAVSVQGGLYWKIKLTKK